MEQANISAFMDALQSAGYHIDTGNQQIIINADGNAMVVDQQVGDYIFIDSCKLMSLFSLFERKLNKVFIIIAHLFILC